MRREGKLGLARRLPHCCAGRGHANPNASEKSSKQLGLVFAAWRETAGVTPQRQPWTVKQVPHCCGSVANPAVLKNGQLKKGPSRSRARICLGLNYSHCANCGMCRSGNPSKSMKKNRGTSQRDRHLELLRDVRYRERDDLELEIAPDYTCLTAQNPPKTRPETRIINKGIKAADEVSDVSAHPSSEASRPPRAPLALNQFIKCRKGCLDCQPRKRRAPRSFNATVPPIPQDWYLDPSETPPATDEDWYLP